MTSLCVIDTFGKLASNDNAMALYMYMYYCITCIIVCITVRVLVTECIPPHTTLIFTTMSHVCAGCGSAWAAVGDEGPIPVHDVPFRWNEPFWEYVPAYGEY